METIKDFFAREGVLIVTFLNILLIRLGIFFLFILIVEAFARVLSKKDYKVFEVNWTSRNIVEIFLIYTVFQAIAVFFKGEVDNANVQGFVVLWSIIEYLFLFAVIMYFVTMVFDTTLGNIGLSLVNVKRSLVYTGSFIVYLLLACAFVNFLYSYEILAPSSKIINKVTLKEFLGGGITTYMKYSLVFLIAPVIEEIFYRGLIYPLVRNKIGPILAIVLVSLFFTAVHFTAGFFIGIFILSAALCYLYEKSRSLIPPIIIHIIYNIMAAWGLFQH